VNTRIRILVTSVMLFGCAMVEAGPLVMPFSTEKELTTFLKKSMVDTESSSGYPACEQADSCLEEVMVTGARIQSITNNQSEGVDEGDIVKRYGEYLIVLRRGRLFTISTKARSLRPIAVIDAYPPGTDASSDWYDEMLVSNNKVVVVGYSYQRGGTEINVFKIDASGKLKYDATYHLKSNDYYSSRNYASRLIGSKLVFYSALSIYGRRADPLSSLPSMRKWEGQEDGRGFRQIATVSNVYRLALPLSRYGIALHTVTTCDLSLSELMCSAVSIAGPYGRVFYASKDAFYVWLTNLGGSDSAENGSSVIFRIPVNSGRPKALRVFGSPIDQFSFLEGDDGFLNVLVASNGDGDAMWSAELTEGEMAMARFPVSLFSTVNSVSSKFYHRLPSVEDGPIRNRFVGNHLLYGTEGNWGNRAKQETELVVVSVKDKRASKLPLPHAIERIEVMGQEAVVIGRDDSESLHFDGIRLGVAPMVSKHYELEAASQGEERSHGFFYKPEAKDDGILGLPIRIEGDHRHSELFDTSSGVVFLRNEKEGFSQIGQIMAFDQNATDDHCIASCVDWYGNSRPIFFGDRLFALMGYELVEGVVHSGRVYETVRANFTPHLSVRSEDD
jgi:hypothetical protein